MTLVYLYYGEEMMVDLWQQAGQQWRGSIMMRVLVVEVVVGPREWRGAAGHGRMPG